ncbi:hypothetical protein F5884DRAFT_685854, partial [Xylogone sp. PMI_703]
TFQDMKVTPVPNKKGYKKVESYYSVARSNRYQYVWIDTCCIDKISSIELSKVINFMYHAEVCYTYLVNVSSKTFLPDNKWFTRG